MRKLVFTFFCLYFLFHVLMIIGTININWSFDYLFTYSNQLKYFSFLGILLFALNLAIFFLAQKNFKNKTAHLHQEIDSLKAKLYDTIEKTSEKTNLSSEEPGDINEQGSI